MKKSLELNPRDSEAWLLLSSIYVSNRRYEEADDAYLQRLGLLHEAKQGKKPSSAPLPSPNTVTTPTTTPIPLLNSLVERTADAFDGEGVTPVPNEKEVNDLRASWIEKFNTRHRPNRTNSSARSRRGSQS